MKQALLIFMFLVLCVWLSAEVISIGTGTVLNTGLPIEPVARYSFSQQIFTAGEINNAGWIDELSFSYNVGSGWFFNGNKQWKIWLGHTTLSEISTWIPLQSMVQVYNGVLSESNFGAGLPGSGWLNISLNTGFYYNGIDNLVLSVNEDTYEYGGTNDDFYCSNTGQQRAIEFHSMNTIPDPNNLPATGYNLKTQRSNLKISIQAMHYNPVLPNPASGVTGFPVDGTFFWTSLCTSFSIQLGTHPDSLVVVADNICQPQWQLIAPLEFYRQYYWKVTGYYQGEQYPSALWSFTTCSEGISPPQNLNGSVNGLAVQLSWQAPANGTVHYYRIYRNSALLVTTQNTSWLDTLVQAGGVYFYYVCAVNNYGNESSASNMINVSIPNNPPVALLEQGFESCAAFNTSIPGWQNLDEDESLTWSWETVSYPHEGEAMPWIVFAPTLTVPAITDIAPYQGSKMLMAMSSLNPPNNDWLISPAIHLGQNPIQLSFMARSATADYGLERLRVLISNTDANPASFTALNQGNYLSVPLNWNYYSGSR